MFPETLYTLMSHVMHVAYPFEDMHAVIRAVWVVIQPLASNLLPQRNYLIIFELITLRTNFLITNHIDVVCLAVTKVGRSYFLTLPLVRPSFSHYLRA